jgi:hypothetical protein
MTKMSETQRTAVRDFHYGVTSKAHTMIGNLRTMHALARNGWARPIGTGRAAYVTTAGLIAAGVDMAAIEAEAHDANEAFDRTAEKYASVMVEMAHAEVLEDGAYHSDTQVQLQRLDAEMDALREQYRAINDQLVAAHELRDEVVTARLAELTDEQIMADETLTRWLFRESWSHSGAADRKRVLVRMDAEGAGDPDSYDGRDEYAADVLPPISVALVKGQDVAPLADAIRAWVQRWALGRPDVPVSIMERTLSEHGSYGGMYDIASDTMCLRIIRWGREEELANGPLEEVLAYMASEFWYRKPGADGSWDSQDDEDDDY